MQRHSGDSKKIMQSDSSTETRQWVIRAQEGDASAFERLVVTYQKRVYFSIYRIVGESHVADDLTQEVFIKMHRSLTRLKEPDNFQGWLFRIAMNRAIDSKRRQKRTQERCFLLDDFQSIPGAESPESQGGSAHLGELQDAVNDAIAGLPPRQKQVLSLTMDENMSQEQIAEIMEVPVGTVKSRLHHARKALKERLRKWISA